MNLLDLPDRYLKRTVYIIIIVFALGYLLKAGTAIILPFLYAILLALFLVSIDRWMLKRIKIPWLSIMLTFSVILIPLILIFILVSAQLQTIISTLPSITGNIEDGAVKVISYIESLIPGLKMDLRSLLLNNLNTIIDAPISFIRKGVVSSTSILISVAMCFLYTFFLLLYRKSFQTFIIYQFNPNNQGDIKDALKEIRDTIESYVGGVGIVMIILSVLNTLGLWIIGISYPLFWGTLGGLLAIIPYVGTTIGGLLPFLYALATTDTLWQPIALAIYYFVVQQLEGNIITPKIVGNKVDINPLFALISLIFFAYFWGVAGIILALPVISIVKIILEQSVKTESIALLMSAEIDSVEQYKRISERRIEAAQHENEEEE